MGNVGPMEIIVVLIIALVVFGPKKLPELGKSLGKGINEFKGSINGDSYHEAPTTPAAHVTPGQVERAPVTSHRVEDSTPTHTHA